MLDLLLAAWLISYPVVANDDSIECHSTPGRGKGWSWRSVNNQKCWYKGHRSIPKDRLYWPAPTEQEPESENDTSFKSRWDAIND